MANGCCGQNCVIGTSPAHQQSLSTGFLALTSSLSRGHQFEPVPNSAHRINEPQNIRIAVQRCWRETEPLGASWYSWIVDRLRIDAVTPEQLIRDRLASPSV